jgi:hypothetical protein
MSKTRKTRPLIVRMLDKNDHGVAYTEHHNHTDGECDLPDPDPSLILEHQDNNNRTKCYYRFAFVGKGLCGCRMCTGQAERKENTRKARHNERKNIKEIVESY